MAAPLPVGSCLDDVTRTFPACSHALLVEELVTGTRAPQTGRLLEGTGRYQRGTLVEQQRRTLRHNQRRAVIGTHQCTSFPVVALRIRRSRSQRLVLRERVTGSEATDTGDLLEGAGLGWRRTLVGKQT